MIGRIIVLFFVAVLFPQFGFSQEFNFDYLLTYSSKYGKGKRSEEVRFVDSSNPNASMIVSQQGEGKQIAHIQDAHHSHIFGVTYDEMGEIKLNYSNSIPLKNSGIIERTAEVLEEELSNNKVKVTVNFYLEKKKRKPRMSYHFIMLKFDHDFATAFLPSFFDSYNRASLTKFKNNYVIDSVWSEFGDYERTTNTLEKIQKIKNPVKVKIGKLVLNSDKN